MQLQRLIYCIPLGAIALLLEMTQPWKTLSQVL